MLVGAPNHDAPIQDAGAAYVYTVPEPSALSMQLAALVVLAALSRRRSRRVVDR